MKVRVSWRKLLENSHQAIVGAIEIYNKPKFDYREEVFSILLTNAWELLFLAILSKNNQRIFEPKIRNQNYKTLRFETVAREVQKYFPEQISHKAVIDNIKLLREYRNTAIHYYHDEQHKHAIYALAHASIKNYHDLNLEIFDKDIADEISIVLLPLSFNKPPDFVEYFKSTKKTKYTPFIIKLFSTLGGIEDQDDDTNRLITNCKIKFEPTRNINLADIIAGKGNASSGHVMTKVVNPDDTHPFFMHDIIGNKLKSKHKNLNRTMNSFAFQSILWKEGIKNNEEYCWVSSKGGSPRYSQKIFEFLNQLSETQIKDARDEYSKHINKKK